MTRLVHVSWDRADLIQEIRRFPHDPILIVEGLPLYGEEAIDVINSLPEYMTQIPIECPNPEPDGRCPGHEVT